MKALTLDGRKLTLSKDKPRRRECYKCGKELMIAEGDKRIFGSVVYCIDHFPPGTKA